MDTPVFGEAEEGHVGKVDGGLVAAVHGAGILLTGLVLQQDARVQTELPSQLPTSNLVEEGLGKVQTAAEVPRPLSHDGPLLRVKARRR